MPEGSDTVVLSGSLSGDMEKVKARFPDHRKHERATLWMRFDVLLSQHFGYLRTEITHRSQDNYASYRNHLAAIQTVFRRDLGV